MVDDNYVYIGDKPIMKYVLAAVTQLNGGNSKVVIKARGRSISKAVDVALVLKERFVLESQLKDIVIRTEVLQSEAGHPTNVSSIEIIVFKPARKLAACPE